MEIWGDESGNLDFDPKTGSRYFLVCTMICGDPGLVTDLLSLRGSLERRGFALPDGFHATEDLQPVRNDVVAMLAGKPIRVDATYFTKARVYPRIQQDLDYFYKWAWFYHLRHVLPQVVPAGVEPFIVVATLGIRKKRQLYAEALRDVVRQSLGSRRWHLAYWSAASHVCLQAADYYTWALARWIEGGDRRSYDLVQHQVRTLYRLV
jgi:hypothetical protein